MENLYILSLLLLLIVLSSVHSKVHDSDENDYPNSYKTEMIDKQETWSDWSEWSSCTRTCGGGIAIQSRKCLDFQGCKGNSVRYMVCNVDHCPDHEPDFRYQQCAEFDNVLYDGQMHTWEPAKGQNTCALTCRAADKNGPPVVLNSRVIDGTRCADDANGMCIHGQCQEVGCDNVLGSSVTKDECGVCGGDGQSCRKTHWIKSSSGTCSTTCGGGYRLVTVTCKDVLSGEVDDKYCSHTPKPPQVVVSCGDKTCPAKWKTGDWDSCSTTCGTGGYQLREVSCEEGRNSSSVRVADHECIDARPPHRRSCGENECPRWFEGIWSECSVTCGEGVQRRAVQCRYSSGKSSDGCSLEFRPVSSRPCRTGIRCPPTVLAHPQHTIEVSRWDSLSEEVGKFLFPSTEPLSNEDKVPAEPTFIASEWSPCTKPCGEGVQIREISCKIFLEFSKTVAILPESHCPGARPVEAKRCFLRDCLPGEYSHELSKPDPSKHPYSSVEWMEPAPGIKSSEYLEPSSPSLGGIKKNPDFSSGSLNNWNVEPSVEINAERLFSNNNKDHFSESISFSKNYEAPNDYYQFRIPSPDSEEGREHHINSVINGGSYRGYSYNEKYEWKSGGFTDCSASCLGGVQESISHCVRTKDLKRVPSKLCNKKLRPVSITRICNDHTCPPEWEVYPFEPCSKSCGGGITRRKVECIHQVTLWKESKIVVDNSECPQPPPYAQQFCNTYPCPFEWVKKSWSKCSSVCGPGYRTRDVECVQVSSLGIKQGVPAFKCDPMTKPISTKRCKIPCQKPSTKKAPIIKSQENQKYYQQKYMKTVNLKIGGLASVFHGAKVKVKCPVRRFNRQQLTWWRDGRRIVTKSKNRRRGRIRITERGILKIRKIQYTDAGIYVCKAGNTKANLTLQVQPLPSSFMIVELETKENKNNQFVYAKPKAETPTNTKISKNVTTQTHGNNKLKQKGFQLVGKAEVDFDSGVKVDEQIIRPPPNTNLHTIEENSFEQKVPEGSENPNRPIIYGTLEHHSKKKSPLRGIKLLTNKIYEADPEAPPRKISNSFFGTLLNSTKHKKKKDNTHYYGTLLHKLPEHEGAEHSENYYGNYDTGGENVGFDESHLGLMLELADESMNTPQILGRGNRDSLQFEWKVTNWTECSQTCSFSGSSGGYQVRSMQCVVKVNNKSQAVEGALCEDAGLSAPPTIQKCGAQECPRWEVSGWSDCENSRCFTLHYALQKREVTCKLHNGTRVSYSFCDKVTKPRHKRECYNRECIGVWKTGEWSKCTAPCEGQGYRTRLLQCVWNGTKKSAGHACREQPRPEVVKWCEGETCRPEDNKKVAATKDCQDRNKYCTIVVRINMCRVALYRQQCCYSCQ